MECFAFIYKEDNSYVAIVPDIGYTSSFGETFNEAVHMITEACELYCEDLKESPKAHSLEYFTEDKLKELNIPIGAIPQLITIKVEKTVRINMTFPSTLLQQVDDIVKNLKTNRSAFFQELARKEIGIN